MKLLRFLLMYQLVLGLFLVAGCAGSDTGCYDRDDDGYYAGNTCLERQQESLLCDENRAQHPDLDEVCDGLDNDCDLEVDEELSAHLTLYRDADGDGAGSPTSTTLSCTILPGYVLTSDDCDDLDQTVHPNAVERCDGVDNDCDGQLNEGAEPLLQYRDADGDGYGTQVAAQTDCVLLYGYVLQAGDCDDNDPMTHPDAPEACDGIDNDCDETFDEGISSQLWFRDQDGDGYGAVESGSSPCQRMGYVLNAGDCNDLNRDMSPALSERCDDLDNNCNGLIDEGFSLTVSYRDADADGYGDAALTYLGCSRPYGYVVQSGDCHDGNASIYPGAAELCNGLDDDCDNQKDETLTFRELYPDADGDGYGLTSQGVLSCGSSFGMALLSGDCDDGRPSVHPNAPETCNRMDDDCDLLVDEGVTLTYYRDADSDGFGSLTVFLNDCSLPTGYTQQTGDCQDADPSIHPAAAEQCNGIDDDCNGQRDQGLTFFTWYVDGDGDGYGNSAASTSACSAPAGFVLMAGDCDDRQSAISPAGVEACDHLDNNCNNQVDEGFVVSTWYQDADGDGYGQTSTSTLSCSRPAGFVGVGGDCDDGAPSVHPNAAESCNSKDDNCNGVSDEGLPAGYVYVDTDGDGYGISTQPVLACLNRSNTAAQAGDCNDAATLVYPGATESCNSRDDDCDGLVDEGFGVLYYQDGDGDGYGNASTVTQACIAPSGAWVVMSGDCDDAASDVYPGADETGDGVDNDCDGITDETDHVELVFETRQDLLRDPAEEVQPLTFTCVGACDAAISVALVPDGTEVGDPLEVISTSHEGGQLHLGVYVPRGAVTGLYDVTYEVLGSGVQQRLDQAVMVVRGEVSILAVSPSRFRVGVSEGVTFFLEGWNLDVQGGGAEARLITTDGSIGAGCQVLQGSSETALGCELMDTSLLPATTYELQVRDHDSGVWDCSRLTQSCFEGILGYL